MSEFLAFIATWAMSIVFQVTCLPNVLIEISFHQLETVLILYMLLDLYN